MVAAKTKRFDHELQKRANLFRTFSYAAGVQTLHVPDQFIGAVITGLVISLSSERKLNFNS